MDSIRIFGVVVFISYGKGEYNTRQNEKPTFLSEYSYNIVGFFGRILGGTGEGGLPM
jgi:hypothetical protein